MLDTDLHTKKLTEEERKNLLGMDISEEFNKISMDLDKFHAVFYQIWELGYPLLTLEIPTAAVRFDKKGHKIDFIFNPLFWKEIDTYTKEFVICHECLHVILNHGLRIKDIKNDFWAKVANKALDVVVNHMLVDKFNFDRYSIKGQEDLCWIDTVFGKDYKKIEKNRSFEYYFGILKNIVVENVIKNSKMQIINKDGSVSDMQGELIDGHEFLEGLDNESIKKKIQDSINNNLNNNEKKSFIDKLSKTEEGSNLIKKSESSEAGNKSSNTLFKMNVHEKVIKKKKWETVIKKWSIKFLKNEEGVEQWARLNRRISNMDLNLLLPSEIDDISKTRDKTEVWFFQDISGSCIHLKDRFFKAARSLPSNRFIVKMFCFDTSVSEVDMNKGELRGGGGTSFSIIESYIQKKIKETPGKKYPEAIFVITDGYGDEVNPEFPTKWYFFLSTKATYCLPKKSNIHMLDNFE